MGGAATMAAETAESLDLVLVFVTLIGGLAIFLHGLDRLTDSLKLVAGNQMRAVLERFTTNRFAGMATGAGVTALLQSSSATTVLVVGFISSGLMSLTQSIGVILGADIGTTITAQIIAFDVSRYALGVVAAGFAISAIARRSHRKAQGTMLMGIGLVFYGMTVMGEAMDPLRTDPRFADLMAGLDNPWIAIGVGAAFTALIQSSAATTGIVIVLASRNLITLEAGIALVLGANIGTTVTALLASIGKPRDAVRSAVAHTLFKVIGVLVWVGFIDVLAGWVRDIGGDPGRQIANAHTIFNVATALLFIGFVPQFAALVRRLVPDRPEGARALVAARYLDPDLLRNPALALGQARREMLRMATRARTMLEDALPAVLEGDFRDLSEVEEIDDEIDALHGQIAAYLARIGESRLSEQAGLELVGLMESTNDLEAIGDIIETNLVGLGRIRLEQNIVVSPQTREVLDEFHAAVLRAFDLAMAALAEGDPAAAAEAIGMKRDVNTLEHETLAHEVERLRAPEPNLVATYRFEIDVIANLKRIYYFSKRIARAGVPPAARPEI